MSELHQADLDRLLERVFGHRRFRTGQREVIKAAAAGRDTVVTMPPGTGASLCFQFMPLVRPGLTIVFSPHVALMCEQVGYLTSRGIAAATLSDGQSAERVRAVASAIIAGEIRVLYMTPETLSRRRETLLPWPSRIPVGLVAVDEAQGISEWGHQFRPAYLSLRHIRNSISAPFMAVSSTATTACRQEVIDQLGLRDPHAQVVSVPRPHLRFSVRRSGDRLGYLLRAIRSHEGRGAAIVYSNSRSEVDELARVLRTDGVNVAALHGGMNGEDRLRRRQDFCRGKTDVMVATTGFGIGMDRLDVRLVLHYGMPDSIESYYQESGRAGRDGQVANCLMHADETDVPVLEDRISLMPDDTVQARRRREASRERLQAMLTYTESRACRWRDLAKYFGGDEPEPCGSCDTCAESAQRTRPPRRMYILYDALVRMRDGLAQRRDRDNDEVFSDATLRLIARRMPRDQRALRRIEGVGEAKARSYSIPVLRIVREYLETEEGRDAAALLYGHGRPPDHS